MTLEHIISHSAVSMPSHSRFGAKSKQSQSSTRKRRSHSYESASAKNRPGCTVLGYAERVGKSPDVIVFDHVWAWSSLPLLGHARRPVLARCVQLRGAQAATHGGCGGE